MPIEQKIHISDGNNGITEIIVLVAIKGDVSYNCSDIMLEQGQIQAVVVVTKMANVMVVVILIVIVIVIVIATAVVILILIVIVIVMVILLDKNKT